ncbi:Predicted arabinose efflux permease, MFS family [Enhydrobacter aerosaccus]|uniref:Predicted arabinose efflux permease, MFS family n=1 Tax=Enhydrobacter aerosaccus TaxID=225324 RepID=A0A1T4SQN6_9HYPH|nr:MFS transporter [Enhydrobacter aerosaccus]SKA30208.1 Predicted arabinose efflux permease, MFS family [Enhydrobacter aerosaccus]
MNEQQEAPSFREVLRALSADFWRLWYVGLVVFTVRWLETVVIGVVVYQLTGSAFIVAMMTMLRLLPLGIFGAFLGALAERFDRTVTLAAVIVLMGITSAILALVAWQGRLEVWHLAVASFVNGCGWATDNPLRRMMMGEVVGRETMGTAMSLDVGASNASRMVGPAVGGLLLAGIGIEGAFLLSVAMYVTALVAALSVRARIAAAPGAGAVLARTWEGIAIVLADRRLAATMAVTVIYNIFAWPFTSMIPVIGRDQLHLGPEGVGILTSLDGIGAFFGAILLVLWLTRRWYVGAYVGGVAVYMVALIVFALADDPRIAGAALVLTGLAGAGFATMQATLVYLAAPAEMRSRVLGVLSVCIGTGPIGFLWLGWLADLIGAPQATAITGGLGLVVLAAMRSLWRRI